MSTVTCGCCCGGDGGGGRSACRKGTARSSRMTGEKGTKRGGAAAAAGEAGPPVVWDETGTVDVTPKPLTSLKPSVLGAKGNLLVSIDKSAHANAEGSPTSEVWRPSGGA